jgi:hypothetical protein
VSRGREKEENQRKKEERQNINGKLKFEGKTHVKGAKIKPKKGCVKSKCWRIAGVGKTSSSEGERVIYRFWRDNETPGAWLIWL